MAGNERELENRMHRTFVLGLDGQIGAPELGLPVPTMLRERPPALLYATASRRRGRARSAPSRRAIFAR